LPKGEKGRGGKKFGKKKKGLEKTQSTSACTSVGGRGGKRVGKERTEGPKCHKGGVTISLVERAARRVGRGRGKKEAGKKIWKKSKDSQATGEKKKNAGAGENRAECQRVQGGAG